MAQVKEKVVKKAEGRGVAKKKVKVLQSSRRRDGLDGRKA